MRDDFEKNEVKDTMERNRENGDFEKFRCNKFRNLAGETFFHAENIFALHAAPEKIVVLSLVSTSRPPPSFSKGTRSEVCALLYLLSTKASLESFLQKILTLYDIIEPPEPNLFCRFQMSRKSPRF